MRKNIFVTPISFIVLFFISQTALHAADLSVGATTWYTAWDYKDDADTGIEYDPAFLYGPVLSLTMSEDLSLSFVFLYGEFTMNFESDDSTMDLNRYDSDLTLNYRISNYFKLFAGAKYMGFTWDSGTHKALGPGGGISATLPAGGNFFILCYASGMYLLGNEESTSLDRDYEKETREYGGNASLSVAYYIPDASTTISLGGRYQQLKIDYTKPDYSLGITDSMSRFYGVTLTAVYTFNI